MRKVLSDSYGRLPLPLKATFCFTICAILQKGISLLTTPFFTRLLSTSEFGRLSVFNSWESIVMILITLSSMHAVLNLCVKYDDMNVIQSSIVGFNITSAFIFFILISIFIHPVLQFTGLSLHFVLLMILYCFFQSTINCWVQVKNFLYSYKIVVAETLIFTAINLFGGLVNVLFISRSAEARIISQVVAASAIGIIIIIAIFKKSKVFYSPGIWKYTFCFCVPQIPHYLSEIILMNSDRIMIDRMCGSKDVAIYSIAYTVGSLINMVTTSVNSSFAPYQFQKIKEKDYETLAKNTNIVISFVGFCLCGIMLFGREIVLIFGGERYIDSISLIIPIALGVFFNYVFQLFARVQEYYEQKYTIVIASVSCAALNIVLNYIFVRKYGYQAAAYTTFFCYLVFCILHYFFYRMVCREHVGQEIYDVKGLAFISVLLILAAMVIGFISKWIVVKYVLMLTVVGVMFLERKRIIIFIRALRED